MITEIVEKTLDTQRVRAFKRQEMHMEYMRTFEKVVARISK